MVSKNKAQRWLIQILDCKVNILAATRPPLFPLLTSVQLPAVQPARNPHTGCAKQTHWGVLWGGGGGACHLSQVIHPSVASPIIRAPGHTPPSGIKLVPMLSLPGALLCRLLPITCKHSHSHFNGEQVALWFMFCTRWTKTIFARLFNYCYPLSTIVFILLMTMTLCSCTANSKASQILIFIRHDEYFLPTRVLIKHWTFIRLA